MNGFDPLHVSDMDITPLRQREASGEFDHANNLLASYKVGGHVFITAGALSGQQGIIIGTSKGTAIG
jgi:hypothetical protein